MFKGACGVDVSGNNCLPKQVLQANKCFKVTTHICDNQQNL